MGQDGCGPYKLSVGPPEIQGLLTVRWHCFISLYSKTKKKAVMKHLGVSCRSQNFHKQSAYDMEYRAIQWYRISPPCHIHLLKLVPHSLPDTYHSFSGSHLACRLWHLCRCVCVSVSVCVCVCVYVLLQYIVHLYCKLPEICSPPPPLPFARYKSGEGVFAQIFNFSHAYALYLHSSQSLICARLTIEAFWKKDSFTEYLLWEISGACLDTKWEPLK